MQRLQWGRRLSTAETGLWRITPPTSGELQWGRRLSTAETLIGDNPGQWEARFNGAAVSQRRKPRGPWRRLVPRRRFNGAAVSQRRKRRARDGRSGGHADASMGPPSLNGGNKFVPSFFSARIAASMGPPSLNGGNVLCDPFFGGCINSASMGPPSLNGGNSIVVGRCKTPHRLLQWGRRLSTAETG